MKPCILGGSSVFFFFGIGSILHFLRKNGVFETQMNSRRFRLWPFAPPLSLD
jgi:hypothetical protein